MSQEFFLEYNHERAILHFINKEYSEAEFFYRKLCHKHPKSNYWLIRGLCFKFLDMHESAIYCFNQSLKFEINESKAHYHLGTSLLALKEYEKAIDFFDKASEIYPTSMMAYYMRSIASRHLIKI